MIRSSNFMTYSPNNKSENTALQDFITILPRIQLYETQSQLAEIPDEIFFARVREQLFFEIQKNDKQGAYVGEPTIFTSPIVQTVGVDYYVARLFKYMYCKRECYILAMIFLMRFCQAAHILLCTQNFHRIFIISCTLAVKYHDDIRSNNVYYAETGGLHLSEFNALEREFIRIVHHHLHVQTELFYYFYEKIIQGAFEDEKRIIIENSYQPPVIDILI
ncbi:MAG: putative Cyclin P/U [Streblomastix strix]|uniref:Putative Cyclin P/U n=1 Tax=Streblomastix strix TaxID=222440 RepID=A0A5J4X1Z9_9EUKA|nr:MAG: putative Cyclin P/U [Streblomastix strix]